MDTSDRASAFYWPCPGRGWAHDQTACERRGVGSWEVSRDWRFHPPNALLKQDGLQLAEASFRDFEGFHRFFFMRFIELSMVCIDFWIIVSMFARCSWMFQRFYRVFSDLYWFFWIVPIDWFWRIHWYSIVFGDFSMVFNGFQWFFDGFHRYVDVVRRFFPWFLSFFFDGVHRSLVFTREHVECRSRHNRVGCIQFHWVLS